MDLSRLSSCVVRLAIRRYNLLGTTSEEHGAKRGFYSRPKLAVEARASVSMSPNKVQRGSAVTMYGPMLSRALLNYVGSATKKICFMRDTRTWEAYYSLLSSGDAGMGGEKLRVAV
jgi:hypothetical protein